MSPSGSMYAVVTSQSFDSCGSLQVALCDRAKAASEFVCKEHVSRAMRFFLRHLEKWAEPEHSSSQKKK